MGACLILLVATALGAAPVQVTAGADHSCARFDDGTVSCWGANEFGQLGDGTTRTRSGPGAVLNLSDAVFVDAGDRATCAVRASGAVVCWGRIRPETEHKEIVASPISVPGVNDAVEVTVGGSMCAVRSSGELSCWSGVGGGASAPATLPHLTGVEHAAAGLYHACVSYRPGGGVACFPTVEPDFERAPELWTVPGVRGADALAAGDQHTCAMTGGSARCWGINQRGQLGDGSVTSRNVAETVTGTGPAQLIAAGGDTSCVWGRKGLSCWGDNDHGEQAISELGASVTAHVADGFLLDDVVGLDLGARHGCALTEGGEVHCWGSHGRGQLGLGWDPEKLLTSTPRAVPGIDNAVAVAVGARHSCALSGDGLVFCWGAGAFVGDGRADPDLGASVRPFPGPVRGIDQEARAIDAGPFSTCVVLDGGQVRCWGADYGGTASPVPDLNDADGVAVGTLRACATRSSGKASCWGDNSMGALGNGTREYTDRPVDVADLSAVVEIDVSAQHACARASDGATWCWGGKALGTTASLTSDRPLPLKGLSTQAIATGDDFTCAVVEEGLSCWGHNRHGQLASNEARPSLRPRTSTPPQPLISLSAGKHHACGLDVAGRVWCWGDNRSGQLGNGTTTSGGLPVAVPDLPAAVDVAAGERHTCAATAEGTVFCWGAAGDGQLGLGASSVLPSAQRVTFD